MNFAETLKKIRIEKGYSQQSLAKKQAFHKLLYTVGKKARENPN